MSSLRVLFIGGSGVISSACARVAVESGIDLTVLNRGQTATRPLPPGVREVRGEGLMLAMELEVEGAAYVDRARERGLLINCTHKHTLRFLPPFVLEERHVKEFLGKMKRVLAQKPKRAAKKANGAAAAGEARSE